MTNLSSDDDEAKKEEFRQMAVERMKGCENIVAVSEELGVSRRLPVTECPTVSTFVRLNAFIESAFAIAAVPVQNEGRTEAADEA